VVGRHRGPAAPAPKVDDRPEAGLAVDGAPAPVPKPLRSIFASYAKEAELAPSTVKRWTPVVERLIAHLGHDDAAAIKRADIVAWKDAVCTENLIRVEAAMESPKLAE